jgi:hypothetical protein
MHVRRLLARPTSIAAAAVLAVGLLAAVTPASQAADTPVLNSWTSARFVYPTSAGPTAHGDRRSGTVTVVDGGVSAYLSSIGRFLLLPAGGVFTPGTSATLSVRRDINPRPLVDPASGELGYALSLSLCYGGATGATLTVDAATYVGGALDSLAAGVDISCGGGWPPLHVDVRLRSTVPTYAASAVLVSYNQPTPPPAGSTRDVSLYMNNSSSVPLTIGDPVVGPVPAGWTVQVTRDSCGTTVAPGGTCSFGVHTVSGGTAMSVPVTIPTPDAPDLDLTTVIATALTMGAPTISTRAAYDGVGVRITPSPLVPSATDYRVQRSTDGGTTWVDLGSGYPYSYADTTIAAGASARYRAVAVASGAISTPSNEAVGARTTDVPVIDPTIDTTISSTTWPAPGSGFPINFLLRDLPDGPGVYAIPDDVSYSTTCGPQSGTVTVRNLVHKADGTIVLADADLTFTCGANPTQVSRWVKGIDSRAEPLLALSTQDYYWYTSYGSQLDPVTMHVTVTNVGTVPWAKSFATGSTAPAGTFTLASNCPAILPVGASCAVTMKARAKADWAGKASLVARGAGIGGADVRAEYDLVLRYDDTAPTRTPIPVTRWLGSQQWGFGPDEYTDAETDIGSTDVRYRVSVGGALSTWRYPADGQRRDPRTVGSWSWSAIAGQEVCLSSRARDRAGNVTAWSPAKCTVKTYDDSENSQWSPGWVQKVGNRTLWQYGGFLHTTKAGAVMSSADTRIGRRVALEVKTCPTCGSVAVYIGSTKVGTISTYSAKDAWHVLRELPPYPRTLRGTLRVVSTSTKPVYLDGWGVRLT